MELARAGYTADARNLAMFKDEQFNATLLMLGPIYHLQETTEQIKAIEELNRVTKKHQTHTL